MDELLKKAKLVRKWSMISTTEAGSGHPTSCLSAADLMTVLFDRHFTYSFDNPLSPANDRLIFSKGHAAPLLYTLYALSGAFPIEELKTLRKLNSRLEGHPTPEFPFTEAATGSLGQGLSVGAGLAIGIKRTHGTQYSVHSLPKVYVLLGDGELAEGQVWEAANFASHNGLDNLIAIADINRLGQSQETMFGHKMEEYTNRFQAFGWEVAPINGHDMNQIEETFEKATNNSTGKPFVIVAETQKGHGISFLSDQSNWHGKPLPKDLLDKALAELGELEDKPVFKLKEPYVITGSTNQNTESMSDYQMQVIDNGASGSDYKIGEKIATREVYGQVLVELGRKNDSIFVLDAEVKNSTFSQDFLKVNPERFIECFIAEQNMVSVAAGLSRFGKTPFVSTFAAFFTRAADQIRMAWLSKANIKFVGSHAGVSIGEDGASQMGLEEFSLFGTLPGVFVLQPSDAVSASKLLTVLANNHGMGYLQTLRPKTPVLYSSTESFEIGGSKILKQSDADMLVVAATGITVHEALKAYEMLQQENIPIRVIDCYSISPVDSQTLIDSVKATKVKKIITVEDHFIHGGFGDFVTAGVSLDSIPVFKMAVKDHSHSGTGAELLHKAEIDADCIVAKVKELLQ